MIERPSVNLVVKWHVYPLQRSEDAVIAPVTLADKFYKTKLSQGALLYCYKRTIVLLYVSP